jgi:hypothetical protein
MYSDKRIEILLPELAKKLISTQSKYINLHINENNKQGSYSLHIYAQ